MSPIDINDASFFGEVLESDRPTLVDFWAPWCGPCRMVAPALEAIAEEHPEWKIVKLNIDEHPETASSLGVLAIPTLIVFDKGEAVGRIQGARPKPAIEQAMRTALER